MFFEKDWLGEAGVRQSKKPLKSGKEFDRYFEHCFGKNLEILPLANVKHTIAFMPQMVALTIGQTRYIAEYLLDRSSLYNSCRALWNFVYDHIRYEKDKDGVEQVRSPARLWADRKGDCDCMTGFIDSVLLNWHLMGMQLSVINVVAGYPDEPDRYKHIYPVCISPQGRRIVIDCVTHRFDYEEPYLFKSEYPMRLEFLNGIEPQSSNPYEEELGKKPSKFFSKAGKIIKRSVHAVNRVNPSTVLLRTGMLASMKMNLMNVAGRLKWAYLDEAGAKKRGLNIDRWKKLIEVREKTERIFYQAGGKPENLKEAILKGRGNKGKEVSGFGVIPIYAMPEAAPVADVIGRDLYLKETAMHGLGIEPVTTTAALASAAAVIAEIAAKIKKIGNLGPGTTESENPDQAGADVEPTETPALPPSSGTTERNGAATNADSTSTSSDSTSASSDSTSTSTTTTDAGSDAGSGNNAKDDPNKKTGFLGWVQEHPVITGVVVIGLGTAVYLGAKSLKKPAALPQGQAQNGLPRGRGKKARRRSKGKSSGNLKYVPLK